MRNVGGLKTAVLHDEIVTLQYVFSFVIMNGLWVWFPYKTK